MLKDAGPFEGPGVERNVLDRSHSFKNCYLSSVTSTRLKQLEVPLHNDGILQTRRLDRLALVRKDFDGEWRLDHVGNSRISWSCTGSAIHNHECNESETDEGRTH